jgi:p-hydroxybenzoate 3-monooxygenase
MRTQVGIVGAGPAGLTLARLLEVAGIESVVLENRSREHVEARIRAGVLEQGTVDLLTEADAAERLHREGLVHHGIELQFDGERHRIPLSDLTGGRSIVIYGQTEVVKDLVAGRLASGEPLYFEVEDVNVDDLLTEKPRIRFRHEGHVHELSCDVVAGCDGFHGVCRESIPSSQLTAFSREYPYGWLGILAAVAPSSDELVYAHHQRGFALLSLRSPELSRLYVQVAHDEDIGEWPDDRIWAELQTRLGLEGWRLAEGPVLEKGVTGMRSFVVEPMQHGRLFLAGDAAHIVPPTGAKGLNLAIHDVRVLAEALIEWYGTGSAAALDAYTERCLRRVWRAEHFSWWMTSMLHRPPDDDPFGLQLQLSQLRYLTASAAAATSLAENYVGLVDDGAGFVANR